MTTKNILGIIPARYASTRFQGKPLAIIDGKTMIRRVYEQSSKALSNIVVATDDERIQKEVEQFGGNVVMTSTAHRSGTDRCAEALELMEANTQLRYKVIINIQGDEPFIDPDQLSSLIKCFDEPATQIATLIKQVHTSQELFNENKPKVIINSNSQAIYFSRWPIPFLRGCSREEWAEKHQYYLHLGLYGYRADVLRAITQLKPSPLEMAESLEQLRWLEKGYQISTSITSGENYSIDTPEDLAFIEEKNLFKSQTHR